MRNGENVTIFHQIDRILLTRILAAFETFFYTERHLGRKKTRKADDKFLINLRNVGFLDFGSFVETQNWLFFVVVYVLVIRVSEAFEKALKNTIRFFILNQQLRMET